MYGLYSRVHVQYNDKCGDLYSMYNLSYRANTDCRMYCYDESCLCVSFSDPNGYTYQDKDAYRHSYKNKNTY